MAGLTWIKFKKSGQTKEVSTRIANNKDYQNDPDRGFTIVGAPEQEVNPQPQKKIEAEKPAAVKSEVNSDKEIAAQIETESLPVELTNEEKVMKLHKEGKSEDQIKEATGINKLTIRKLIKNA